MSIVNDFFDPYYRDRAKRKIEEMKRTVDSYKKQYEDYEAGIDELNDAKAISLQIIKNVEEFINSLANKPKELSGVIVTPNLYENNFEKEIGDVESGYKKNVKKSIGSGVALGVAGIAFLPAAFITLPAMFFGMGKEKKNNLKTIEECEKKIKKIEAEIKKIQKTAAGTITEQEFLVLYSGNIRDLLTKIQATGITDYNLFSEEERSDLGALVNSTKALIKRIDNRA